MCKITLDKTPKHVLDRRSKLKGLYTQKEKSMNILITAWIAIVFTVAVGWIKNIVELISVGFDAGVTVEIALRVVGIFVPPLGAFMGYLV